MKLKATAVASLINLINTAGDPDEDGDDEPDDEDTEEDLDDDGDPDEE